MVDADVIHATLEIAGEHGGDPTPLIYQRLFAAHPELETLFQMDRDGGVRAEMVQTIFGCIFDHIGPRNFSSGVIGAARLHHSGYGVPDNLFDTFFLAMRDTIREAVGRGWTPEMESSWRSLVEELSAIGATASSHPEN